MLYYRIIHKQKSPNEAGTFEPQAGEVRKGLWAELACLIFDDPPTMRWRTLRTLNYTSYEEALACIKAHHRRHHPPQPPEGYPKTTILEVSPDEIRAK